MEAIECSKCFKAMLSSEGVAVRAGGAGALLHDGLICSECAEILVQVWDEENASWSCGCIVSRAGDRVEYKPQSFRRKAAAPRPRPDPLKLRTKIRHRRVCAPPLPVDISLLMSTLGVGVPVVCQSTAL